MWRVALLIAVAGHIQFHTLHISHYNTQAARGDAHHQDDRFQLRHVHQVSKLALFAMHPTLTTTHSTQNTTPSLNHTIPNHNHTRTARASPPTSSPRPPSSSSARPATSRLRTPRRPSARRPWGRSRGWVSRIAVFVVRQSTWVVGCIGWCGAPYVCLCGASLCEYITHAPTSQQ